MTRTGLDAQFGVAEESSVGTRVAPTRFIPFTSESIALSIERLVSNGIRAGRTLLDSADWAPGAKSVAGDVSFDARVQSIGLLLKHTLGAVATTGSGPYTHTFTPGDLFGKGLTVQVGRPDAGGVVRPFEYAGCKISSIQFSCSVDGLLEVTVSFVGRDEDTGQSLATATFTAADKLLTFVHGSVTIGGTPTPMETFTLTIDNGLQDRRHRLGSAVSTEQRQNSLRSVTLSSDIDFVDLTAYNRFVSGAEAAVVLTFNDADGHTLTFTLNCRTDGNTPTVGDVEEIPLSTQMVAVGSTDAAAITAVLVNDASTP